MQSLRHVFCSFPARKKVKKSLYILVLIGMCGGAFAQGVVDFDNVPWMLNGDTINGGAIINSNAFVVTDGTPGETRSAWFRDPLFVGAFQASFTYQDVGGDGADGIAFVLHNDPRGTNALGYAGGGLGFCDITPSVAVLFNIYSGVQGGTGIMIGTNGIGAEDLSGAASGNAYQSTAPVNLASGDPINVSLHYDGATLQVMLADAVANSAFETNVSVNIPSFVSSNVAWVGITGSEGDGTSDQIVSNFAYAPLPTLAMSKSGSNMVLSWPAAVLGYTLQSKANLTDATWNNISAPIISTNGSNQVVMPSSNQFYRLATFSQWRRGGMMAKGVVNFSGAITVDSFNSANGPYNSLNHGTNAIVLTDSGATGAIYLNGAKIYGTLITGPTGTISLNNGASVGDAAWVSNNIGIEPGHSENNANLQMPDVQAPNTNGWISSIVFGTNYTYLLTNGNYVLGQLTIGAGQNMVVTGNVTLFITNNFTISGSGYGYVGTNSSLTLYLGGRSTFSGGGIENATGSASNVAVYGLSNCTILTYSGSQAFIGTVYAPEAALTYSGSAAAYGGLTANTITFSGGANFHFDENLVKSPYK